MLLNTGAGTGGLLITTGTNAGDVGTSAVSGTNFQETDTSVEGLHFYNANSGTAPFALRIYNQNGITMNKIYIEGQDLLATGIDIVGTEQGKLNGLNIRGAADGMVLRYAGGVGGISAGQASMDIGSGFIHNSTGNPWNGSSYNGTHTTVGTGSCIKISSVETVTLHNMHLDQCSRGIDLSLSDQLGTGAQGIGISNLEVDGVHFEINQNAGIYLGPRIYYGAINIHDSVFVEPPLPAISPTTISASIAAGIRTVTPASMVGIAVGDPIVVTESAGTNSEIITPTAVTGSTFTANFTIPKTGPSITVTSPQYGVAIKSVGGSYVTLTNDTFVGQVLIDSTSDHFTFEHNNVFGVSLILNNSTSGFVADHNYNVATIGPSFPAILTEEPTRIGHQIDVQSQSLSAGSVATFRANSIIGGNWYVGVQGAGVSNFVGIRLGSDPPNAPGFWGDTANASVYECGAAGCPTQEWSVTNGGFKAINVPVFLNDATFALAVGSPTMEINRNITGGITDTSKHSWSWTYNSGGNNVCLVHFSGSNTFLGNPFCVDASGTVTLQNPLPSGSGGSGGTLAITGGGTGATTASAARANLAAVTRQVVSGIATLSITAAGGTYNSTTQSSINNLINQVSLLVNAVNSIVTALNQ